jgi:hypothetical protein
MKLWIVIYYVFMIARGVQASSVPADPVPSIDDQIKLYRLAYQPYQSQNFNPEQTHIEGLIPLIRIAHSYTASLLPSHDERLKTLEKFWHEAESLIQNKKLTIGLFKKLNLRLAFLRAKDMTMAPFSEEIPLLKGLKSTQKWDQLEAYDQLDQNIGILKSQPYPLCFEAILYHPKGGLKLSRFIESFIDPNLILGLSVLPEMGKGPHFDYVSDPASFLLHDFSHWEILKQSLGGQLALQHLPIFQQIVRTIYQKEGPQNFFAIVGLFLLVHEFEPDTSEIFFPPFSSSSLTPKEIFKRWINQAKQEIYHLAQVEEEPIAEAIRTVHFPNPHLSLALTHFNPIGNDKYYILADLLLKEGDAPLQSHFENDKSDDEEIGRIVGSVSGVVTFQETVHKHKEHLTLSFYNANLLPEIPLGNLTANEVIHMALNEAKEIDQMVYSRQVSFNRTFYDYIELINLGFPSQKLSKTSTPQEIKNSLLKYLDHFYKKYQSVF